MLEGLLHVSAWCTQGLLSLESLGARQHTISFCG